MKALSTLGFTQGCYEATPTALDVVIRSLWRRSLSLDPERQVLLHGILLAPFCECSAFVHVALILVYPKAENKIPKHENDKAVVVITGASSGIGRATAHAFARLGATVVLAARNEEALEEALYECERLGGRGIVVVTDVGDADQVDHLAETAVQVYEKIHVWINNAAVSLFGRLEETPREEYEQVIHTNLLGCINGSRAAIRQFREQGWGRLINVSSMVGHAGQPYTSAYVTTKWAIRGLTECLRMELADAPDITASTVMPTS